MCLLAISWRSDPRFPLVLIANRDELHARPSAPVARWEDAPQVLGGRDLDFGGTWLGVSEAGRLAAVTNVRGPRDPGEHRTGASRGLLTRDFLTGDLDAETLGRTDLDRYNPFNLIAIDGAQAWFLTNRPAADVRPLAAGLHGLSNGPIDDVWPKTLCAKTALANWLVSGADDPAPLFAVLADETVAPDQDLPDTGVGLERERALSPAFVRGEVGGTRCSTVILVDSRGAGRMLERRFGPLGASLGETALGFSWPARRWD